MEEDEASREVGSSTENNKVTATEASTETDEKENIGCFSLNDREREMAHCHGLTQRGTGGEVEEGESKRRKVSRIKVQV
jgi:hypothetical protein